MTSSHLLSSDLHLIVALSVIAAVVITFTAVANVTVLAAILQSRRVGVHNSITKLIMASMTMSDLILTLFVMPFLVVTLINNGWWTLGQTLCSLWNNLTLVVCVVGAWHILSMAVDKYLAVCRPLVYRQLSNKTAIMLTCLSWLIPSLTLTLSKINNADESDLKNVSFIFKTTCASSSSPEFFIGYITMVFYLPLTVSYVFYVLILSEIRQYFKRIPKYSNKLYTASPGQDNNDCAKSVNNKVRELKIELEERDLPTSGLKIELVNRLREALIAEGKDPETQKIETEMRPVEVIEWIRKRDPQAMKSIGCSDDKLTESDRNNDKKNEPPETLVTCVEPPETLVTSDEPPGTLVTHEEPPETLVTCDEPPETLVTCDEPPETLVTCDEPPETLVTHEEPPETLVTGDEPPETLVNCEEPPGTLVTHEEPPETLVTGDEPPETLVNCEEPPETLVTGDEPPETLVNCEDPPETLVTHEEPT
ncbi:hypothetical protein Btru_050306 [Bulinus truncatus]|nr:hypothetical protein Btru_050306 [Bulinus truncatus]